MLESDIASTFAVLQRATTVLEIGGALGDDRIIDAAMAQVDKSLSLIKDVFKARKESIDMAKKNHTSEKIKNGNKTPKNNQGVKPNPKGGSTVSA